MLFSYTIFPVPPVVQLPQLLLGVNSCILPYPHIVLQKGATVGPTLKEQAEMLHLLHQDVKVNYLKSFHRRDLSLLYLFIQLFIYICVLLQIIKSSLINSLMFKLFLFAHYELFCLLFLTDIPSLLGFLLRTFFFLIPENISNFM